MTDYTKWCWNCSSRKVFPVQTWFQCDDCGATYIPQVEVTYSPVTLVDVATGGPPRPGRPTEYRPSAANMRDAARERERKSVKSTPE